MLNYYKFTDTNTEFLCYSDNEIKFPEGIPVEMLKENVNPSNHPDIPILNFEQLIIRGIHQKARTIDKVLAEHGCDTFNQLSAAYYLIKQKQLNKPKSVRDAIEKKYADIICYVDASGTSTTSGFETS